MDPKDLFALIHNMDDKELYALLLDLKGCITNNSEAVRSHPDQSPTTTITNTNVRRSSAEVRQEEPRSISHSTSKPLPKRYTGFEQSAWRRIKKPVRSSFKGSGRRFGKSRFFREASGVAFPGYRVSADISCTDTEEEEHCAGGYVDIYELR